MQNNNSITVLILTVLLATSISLGGQKPIPKSANSNTMLLYINGVVCSFCAYGVEKNISKLNFVDKEEFGGDGVFIDLKKGILAVNTDPTKQIDLATTFENIMALPAFSWK